MTRLRVWAPAAGSVAVVSEDSRTAMRAAGGGWWEADVDASGAEIDYGFAVDGGEPLPDPRSGWQPYGVHGRSRTVDHAAFDWTDANWQPPPFSTGVVYELHVGTFTAAGTFDAAIERLDHLAALGVTHVELMPVAEFPGERGWGYDGVDLWAPHHAYGGPAALKRLVDACHRRGLAVLLDVVYNHLGPDGNYLGRFGPYFTDRYRTPWGDAVNFDGPGSDEVRRFFVDNALMWLRDYHFDGLRIDAVHAIIDTSAVHFLEELSAEVKALEAQLGRPLVLVAESDLNDPRIIRPVESGGFGVDAQWSDDFHHALHALLTAERSGYYADFGSLAQVAKALERGYVYDGCYSPHRQRKHGRPADGLAGEKFVVCLQNHDQIGNRAKGERLSQLVSRGRLEIAAALLFTSPFVPMLFQGEEWGASTPFQYFTAHPDPELGRAVREGRRREFAAFGWQPEEIPDPQDPATFERSQLDWSELASRPHESLLEWHRSLIALRRALPDLAAGELCCVHARFDAAEGWLVVERGDVMVACNFAETARTVPMPGPTRVCLGSTGCCPDPNQRRDDPPRADAASIDRNSPQTTHEFVELPPESVAILERYR